MSVTKTSNTGYLHNLCSRGAVREINTYLAGLSSTNQLEERVGFLGYTPLHEATHRSHVSVVRLLLLYGANSNATSNGYYTCLHMAASMDNVECVKELLKNNANIECRDEFGKTPYETAVIHKCKHTAKLLKSAEIFKLARDNNPQLKETLRSIKSEDISPSCLQEALQIASQKGHVDAIYSVILAGVNQPLKFNDCVRMTLKFNFIQALSVLLMCHAAQNGLLEMLQYLLDLPLSQEKKDIALQQLPYSKKCHTHINNIRSFLKDESNINVAVPIQLAIQNNRKEATRILLLCINCNTRSKKIDWGRLALREIDPSLLKDIRWAERLDLPQNMLTSIPSNIIDLHKLCRLYLQNNQLQRIPSGLLKMNCLRTLNLSKNKLKDLPKRSHWSPSLTTFDVSDNFLESLPKNMAKSKLRNLYLARNNLYEVPLCVCEILTLLTLDLSGNKRLTQLPLQMGKLTKISTLKLNNLDQVTDPPDEIKKNGVRTIMYLRAKLRSSKGYYSMKLMLVGRAAQGKTTLMHRLMLDNNYSMNSCTNGISMDEFHLKKDLFHQEYIFRIWDFGGQEDYYATHQCFLSSLSLYILVWNLEEGPEGVTKLEGWLDTISARAPGTCFIIVGTHLDKIRMDKVKYDEAYVSRMHQLVEDLRAHPKYNRIVIKGIKEVSCGVTSREGIDDLRIAVYDAASTLLKADGHNPVAVMGEMIPHSYFLIEELIKNRKDEFKKSGKLPIIHRADFEALVTDEIRRDSSDIEDPDDIKDVTKFLHERGILMHYNDPNQDLQDYYFIDPAWLCDLMARVVTLKEANPHIDHNGILFRERFQFIFKDDRFPYENYPQFVRLLNRFQIACSLDENRLLVPSKLPEDKPDEATNQYLPFITVKRCHSLPFMPYGFWDRFIARFLYYTEDMLISGCSSVPRPCSPGGPELEYQSPFLLDPSCCKCPLTSSNAHVSDTEESLEIFSTSLENEHGTTQSTRESPCSPREDVDSSSCDEEDAAVEEADSYDDFAFAGVTRYVNEDNDEKQGGVFINGQWFGNATSGSRHGASLGDDCDFGYSTDEEDANDCYGYAQGLYIPRLRNRGMNYERKATKGSRKRSKQPYNATDSCPRNLSFSASSSSVPNSFNEDPFENTSSSEQSRPSYEGRTMNETNGPLGSYGDNSSITSPSSRSSGQETPSSLSSDKISMNEAKSPPIASHKVNHGNRSPRADYNHGSTSSQSSTELKAKQLTAEDGCSSGVERTQEPPNQSPVEREKLQKRSPELLSSNTVPMNPRTVSERRLLSEENDCSSLQRLLPGIEQYLQIDNPETIDNNLSQMETTDNGSTSASKADATHPHRLDFPLEYSVDYSVSEKATVLTSLCKSREDVTNILDKFEFSNESCPNISLVCGGEANPVQVDVYEREQKPSANPNLQRNSKAQRFFQEPVHDITCPTRGDFPVDQLPDIPTDLGTLIDDRFLKCWRTGVCLYHPKLFFMISIMQDPSEEGRVLIETEVSPSRVGRRVLNYIVDHIDTLIREWYPDLSVSDGVGPRVRQFIPCVACERLNIVPHNFSFVECQLQSSEADTIPCPNHSGYNLNLHLVAPDIMLQDIDPDLLLSSEEITYDESESNLLGSGGFGKVVRGTCRGQSVAIKFFVRNDETDPLKHYFEARKELNVLRRVRQHPYLISIIGVCLRPLCLVLELAEKGSLQESLFSSMVIHRVVLCRIAYQVADAMSYLHTLGVIYRDLKPENILVWSLDERDDLHVKLIDFGTANFATSTGLISVKGSLGTKAPEMLDLEKKEEYTMQVDVYSYAILLYQIVCRKQPFLEMDSEPKVNDAVIRGERPKWRGCSLTSYGFPNLTELMLQCWVSKPTSRPKSSQISKQVRMPAFQALIGKQPVPSQQSVRHACIVPDVKELWIGCDDYSTNKILIFDCNNLDLKHTFVVNSFQDETYALQIQAMHYVADLVLVAFRGDKVNFIAAYSATPRYKLVWCIPLNEQVTCVASDESYVYVGMNEGYVRCILKKDFKKPEKKRNDRMIKIERHCILSVVATDEKLWVSSSKYICTYYTKSGEMEAFDMESMWYGGFLGVEGKPQTQINNLTHSFDKQSIWSTCRSMLTKWSVTTRQRTFEIDCAPIVHAISPSSSLHDGDACIASIAPTLDTIWAGTTGGHILIFSSEEPRLLTWFHPFGEVRTLSVCIGPGPCATEQYFVISTGKNLRPDGLGTSNPVVCPLTTERVRDIPDEISNRKPEMRHNAHRRSSSGSKKTANLLNKEQVDGDGQSLMFKCSMVVWEAMHANVLERLEAKSGRDPIIPKKSSHPTDE